MGNKRDKLVLLEFLETIGLSDLEGVLKILDEKGERIVELGLDNNEIVYIKDKNGIPIKGKQEILAKILWNKGAKIEFNPESLKFRKNRLNISVSEFVLKLAQYMDELGKEENSEIPKEGGLEMLSTELFDKVLATLATLDGFEGAAIANDEGLVLASRFAKKYPEDKIVALISSAVKEAAKVTAEANWGKPDNMVIEGETGKLVLYNTSFGFVAVLGNKDLKLGMARVMLDELSEQLSQEV